MRLLFVKNFADANTSSRLRTTEILRPPGGLLDKKGDDASLHGGQHSTERMSVAQAPAGVHRRNGGHPRPCLDKLEPASDHDLPVAFLRLALEPFKPACDGLQPAHLYTMAGMLKDMSLLRPGLATKLAGDLLPAQIRYFYQNGLRSFLFEQDHSRFSLGTGCVDFADERGGMKVEGCLRFLHAGTPNVWSYVNFSPTQGGAHVEGVGKALQEIFPDAGSGCRPLTFVTNSNTGARVHVPHSFIGALHLQMKDPRFDGPTKDILLDDDVREFVYGALLPKLKDRR